MATKKPPFPTAWTNPRSSTPKKKRPAQNFVTIYGEGRAQFLLFLGSPHIWGPAERPKLRTCQKTKIDQICVHLRLVRKVESFESSSSPGTPALSPVASECAALHVSSILNSYFCNRELLATPKGSAKDVFESGHECVARG